jgi:DNA repair photolyase
MKPIYEPKGKAKEYGDLALNIYTGCPHRCYYCFAPNVLHRDREKFHSCVEPRPNIVEETRKQIEREGITDKLIHLCFTCDPYPTGYDTTVTREIIKVIKESGNHVQILTKGSGARDFDLLGPGDWYGVTFSGAMVFEEGGIHGQERMFDIVRAKNKGIKTWVSFEPVIDDIEVLACLMTFHAWIDKVKIGKLNYYPSDIDWKKFGEEVESLCKTLGLDYYIKDGLRNEMMKGGE